MANNRNNAFRGETVRLSIQYYGPDGLPADATGLPQIKIVAIDGTTLVASTSSGVVREGVGLYSYSYAIDENARKGLWTDTWYATVEEALLTNEFKFLVLDHASATAGSVSVGDDVSFDFSEAEITGINILLKYLKARLRSEGQKPARDAYGAFIYDANGNMVMVDCPVFSDEILVTFLIAALSEFNMIPFFTSYTFADRIIYTTFAHAITEGAYILAVASQALVEKGRDFNISDGGINYQPPQLGDFLQSNYNNFLTSYRDRLKFIKNSIRPSPVSYGTYSNLSSGAPAWTRLRHLKGRRIV